ncbi:alpha,alpha-trehalase TreF [Halalkalicoccus sp. NIPERK01]|uniref:alpha,alpha-trehalase TreF n=1 Tax=Halalkalicoccus sp. NIPERK01 TaxID=3053469 RepID=UPI00256F3ADD|nr:alpha,alpha-trehalase TreF [Halalkalicoccus sp. NIPERK01]MDL5363033.1 alpha,alpha-trehalase TreF [Halalkalicoccus sp. NIPERK01]
MPSHASYPQLDGPLFEMVQQEGVFPDSKTLVDCVPATDPDVIDDRFRRGDFDLERFVRNHFVLPEDPVTGGDPTTVSMEWYIDELWDHLIRDPVQTRAGETILELPHRSVIPGGRFREIYYWDSYFAAEGLAVTGRFDLIAELAANFASLIERFGFVPNGGRIYYTSRSNPPLFHRVLDLLAHRRGPEAVVEHLPALEREYDFWMDGAAEVGAGDAHRRVVGVEGGVLNRYWDDDPSPRVESYREDVELAAVADREPEELYRDVRAACESGWDFSSRWFAGGGMETIRTTGLVPVDLNAFLYGMEYSLAGWHERAGDADRAEEYRERAMERRALVDRYCWDAEAGFYFDHAWAEGEQSDAWTLAAAVPLFTGMASAEQAAEVAEILEDRFLRPGGLVTTLTESGEQWDAPNGWAPLQWMAVVGLAGYGHEELATRIAGRWLDLNRAVFDRTGQMLEKYDVTGGTGEGLGGEYPLQYGFGWTNGVALALPRLFY